MRKGRALGRSALWAGIACVNLLSGAAFTADAEKAPAADGSSVRLKPVIAELAPQHNRLALAGGAIILEPAPDLGYLTPDQTVLLLHDILGYPSKMRSLGSLVPTTVPVGSPASWDAIINYRRDGHVGADATHLDANALLSQIVKENQDYNAALKQKGYEGLGVTVVCWAEKPVYDSIRHVLYWALETTTADKNHAVSYHIAFFGKEGTLSLSILAKLEQLPMHEDATKKIIASIHFAPSRHYEDFDAKTDASARYGVEEIINGHSTTAITPSDKMKLEFMVLARCILLLLFVTCVLKFLRRKKPK